MPEAALPPAAVDLEAGRRSVDAALGWVCGALLQDVPPAVAEAIQYALQGPGKRLRGILLASSYRAAGGRDDPMMLTAAVEVVHAYSLVHDDLPCMDDDDMRRGRPTTHRVYGTPVATVAGIAMIPLAARCVIAAGDGMPLDRDTVAAIVGALMSAAGAAGMIGGQWHDLTAERTAVSLETLETIHRTKTGALIAAAAACGGLAAGARGDALDALQQYGEDLGLAFQIVDDVLDVTATTDQLGKTAGRDVELGKSTYPALLGVEEALAKARGLVQGGCRALSRVGLLTPELQHFADLVITRSH